MRRAKLVLAALSVTVAAFMAFAGPAMAVECDHVARGVLECGKHDNVYLSQNRFFDDGFRHHEIDPGFFWSPLVLGFGCEWDWGINEIDFDCD